MDTDPLLEKLMVQLGDWGKYQFRQFVLHTLGGFLAGLHMLTLTATAPSLTTRCFIDEIDVDSNYSHTFDPDILRPFIPVENDVIDGCSKYKNPYVFNETVPCEKRIFDLTYQKESRVIEWDLVCDKRWERAVMQSIYMFGVLVGAIVLGTLADKFGRKIIFCLSGILQFIAALATAFMTNFIAYCGVLFFYGMFGSGGAYVTGFVLTMELVGPSKRTLCGTIISFAFGMGLCGVAFWGYFVSSITLLQIIYALHSLLLFGHWWLIDESIRWLWGQGKIKEAVTIVEKATTLNGTPFDKSEFDVRLLEKEGQTGSVKDEKAAGLGDLLKAPTLRIRAFNVALCWLANALVYYGLSLNAGNLVGDPNVMLGLLGLVEIPSYIAVVLLVDRTGRRSFCTFLMVSGGISCIVVAFTEPGLFTTTLVMIGKMMIAGSFAIAYNYTAEIFPTVVRNSAVGFGAMAARLGGLLTPLLGLLDSLDKELPTIIFGSVSVISGLLVLFLPETMNKEMPQTIEDGERFGKGDTGYRTCYRFCTGKRDDRTESIDGIEKLNSS